MEKNKLRKISKKELLEIMLNQAKRIKELENELSITKEELTTRKIDIKESGSLADASLKLSGVFETAQIAIDKYKYNVEMKCKRMIARTKKMCKIQKDKIINETLERCKEKEAKLDERLMKVSKIRLKLKEKELELKKKEKELSKINNSTSKKKVLEIEKNNKETSKKKKVSVSTKKENLKINVSNLKQKMNKKEVNV